MDVHTYFRDEYLLNILPRIMSTICIVSLAGSNRSIKALNDQKKHHQWTVVWLCIIQYHLVSKNKSNSRQKLDSDYQTYGSHRYDLIIRAHNTQQVFCSFAGIWLRLVVIQRPNVVEGEVYNSINVIWLRSEIWKVLVYSKRILKWLLKSVWMVKTHKYISAQEP